MKNFKMKTIVISIVAISTAIGIFLLCLLAYVNSNKILREKINENMSTYLDAQANSVEEFVEQAENKLVLYSKNQIVKDVIEDDRADYQKNNNRELPMFNDETYNTTAYYKDNYEHFEAAQAYTMEYYSSLRNWEGLYIGNFETRILTYSVPPVIGKILRAEPERVNQLMDAMKSNPEGVYNAGIIVSPGTGKLCLSMYYPVYDNGEMIGYVGAGVFHYELENLLTKFKLEGVESSNFYMLNTDTGIVFTDTEVTEETEEEIIAKEATKPVLLEVINKVKDGNSEKGQFEFKDGGVTKIVSYKKIPGRDWTVVVTADKNEMYASSKSNLITLAVLGIVAYILIIAMVAIAVNVSTKPLDKITNSIKKLGGLNLSEDHTIKAYVGGGSEVGMIASEVDSLSETFRGIMGTLSRCGDSLSANTDEMNQTFRSLRENIEDNAATTEELSASITNTNDAIENVCEEMNRMEAMVKDISQKVKDGS